MEVYTFGYLCYYVLFGGFIGHNIEVSLNYLPQCLVVIWVHALWFLCKDNVYL